jgi:hypothetical protein
MNVGGGPDRPQADGHAETPPDPDRVAASSTIRVVDIQAGYEERSADGYIIEVGLTTLARGWRPPS